MEQQAAESGREIKIMRKMVDRYLHLPFDGRFIYFILLSNIELSKE